jgi:hypothetical protein
MIGCSVRRLTIARIAILSDQDGALEAAYLELLDLRERVRKAELAKAVESRRRPCSPTNVPARSTRCGDDDLPPEYWQALLEDAGSEVGPSGSSMAGAAADQNSPASFEGELPALQPDRRDTEGRCHGSTARTPAGRMSGSACWTTPPHSGLDVTRKTAAGHPTVYNERLRRRPVVRAVS